MTFENILSNLKNGEKIRRLSWYENNLFISLEYSDKNSYLQTVNDYASKKSTIEDLKSSAKLFVYRPTHKNEYYLSLEDVLADDWEIVTKKKSSIN